MTISILSLHTYPVKSCGALTHTQAAVSATGFAHDRSWVVVDEHGRFLTQRAHPGMALVQPTLDATALFLNAPEMPTLRISLRPVVSDAPATPLRIWNSDTLGHDEGDTAGRWFSDFLGLNCRLYRVHQNARRAAGPPGRKPSPNGALAAPNWKIFPRTLWWASPTASPSWSPTRRRWMISTGGWRRATTRRCP